MPTSIIELPQVSIPEGYTADEFEELKEEDPGAAIRELTQDKPVRSSLDTAFVCAKQYRRCRFYESACRMLAASKSREFALGEWKTSKGLRAELKDALPLAMKIVISPVDEGPVINNGYEVFKCSADGDIIGEVWTFLDFSDIERQTEGYGDDPNRLPMSCEELASCFDFQVEFRGGMHHLVPGTLTVTNQDAIRSLITSYVDENGLISLDEWERDSPNGVGFDFHATTDVSYDHEFDQEDIYKNVEGIGFDVSVIFS